MVNSSFLVGVKALAGYNKEAWGFPKQAYPGDAGMDCYAAIPHPIVLSEVGMMVVIPLGIATELPDNTEIQLRARSGLAFKHGVGLVNGIGTIDSKYKDQLKVMLVRHANVRMDAETGEIVRLPPLTINPGDRVCQAVVAETQQVALQWVEELSDSERGLGGMGSSGQSAGGSDV